MAKPFENVLIHHHIFFVSIHKGMYRKARLGQFYSARWQELLVGLHVPKDMVIIEPFVGAGDLLNACHQESQFELYDIDPQDTSTIRRDTIADPPRYAGKFVLTNPPYLARNKSPDKKPYDRYGVNDLYKCFITELTRQDAAAGGILVLPLNFWSGVRRADVALRTAFLRKYDVVRLNVFEQQMFPDTTAAVCTFQFVPRDKATIPCATRRINVWYYPGGTHYTWTLHMGDMAMHGGTVYGAGTVGKEAGITVERLTSVNDTSENETYKCNIVLHAVDTKSDDKRVRLEIVSPGKRVVDRNGRSRASFLIRPLSLTAEEQRELCVRFNANLDHLRHKYRSAFLPSFREFKRKRIPFNLAFGLVADLVATLRA